MGSGWYLLARDNGNPPRAADMDFVGLGEQGDTSLHSPLKTIGLEGGHFRLVRDMAEMARGGIPPSESNG